jgi:hypothetical protein
MLTKLSRETLAEQAARNLIAFIEEQDLKPGKLLPPETKLAADLGVSRSIIRPPADRRDDAQYHDPLSGERYPLGHHRGLAGAYAAPIDR